MLRSETTDQLLTATVTVDVGGVEERHSGLNGGAEHLQRRRLAYLTPFPTELPGAQPDDGHGTLSTAEYTFLHTAYPTDESSTG